MEIYEKKVFYRLITIWLSFYFFPLVIPESNVHKCMFLVQSVSVSVGEEFHTICIYHTQIEKVHFITSIFFCPQTETILERYLRSQEKELERAKTKKIYITFTEMETE